MGKIGWWSAPPSIDKCPLHLFTIEYLTSSKYSIVFLHSLWNGIAFAVFHTLHSRWPLLLSLQILVALGFRR